MIVEPQTKRAVAYVDGQNLFGSVKDAFGYSYPNYDVKALAQAVCDLQGWQLVGTHFYTGVPAAEDDYFWNYFWMQKLRAMSRQGVHVFSRPLRYFQGIPKEKGVDVRLAIDVIRGAMKSVYDVALVFSQDQDLMEVADELRQIAREQKRWIKMASAFPMGSTNKRGINKTDWIEFDLATYNGCVDTWDYRPKSHRQEDLGFK